MSHHKEEIKCQFSKNVKLKPDVKRLTRNGAEFINGSTDDFSVILYCTGILIDFNFLKKKIHRNGFVISNLEFKLNFQTYMVLSHYNIPSHFNFLFLDPILN